MELQGLTLKGRPSLWLPQGFVAGATSPASAGMADTGQGVGEEARGRTGTTCILLRPSPPSRSRGSPHTTSAWGPQSLLCGKGTARLGVSVFFPWSTLCLAWPRHP